MLLYSPLEKGGTENTFTLSERSRYSRISTVGFGLQTLSSLLPSQFDSKTRQEVRQHSARLLPTPTSFQKPSPNRRARPAFASSPPSSHAPLHPFVSPTLQVPHQGRSDHRHRRRSHVRSLVPHQRPTHFGGARPILVPHVVPRQLLRLEHPQRSAPRSIGIFQCGRRASRAPAGVERTKQRDAHALFGLGHSSSDVDVRHRFRPKSL